MAVGDTSIDAVTGVVALAVGGIVVAGESSVALLLVVAPGITGSVFGFFVYGL